MANGDNTIIKEIKRKCETNKDNDFNYNILLIISDGLIDDINKTIDSIIEASKFPISFIIIGIGSSFPKLFFIDSIQNLRFSNDSVLVKSYTNITPSAFLK